MARNTFNPAPLPEPVLTELGRFKAYNITRTAIGYRPLAEVSCASCGKWHGPTWPTVENLRKLCNRGHCWGCF